MTTIVLGSSSPRRLELLQHLFPAEQILPVAPADDREQPLAGLLTAAEVQQGILEIAARKAEIVREQLDSTSFDYLLTADTVVQVPETSETFRVLGKPCEKQFPEQVANWFQQYYLGKSHQVLTAVWLETAAGLKTSRVVSTSVHFTQSAPERVQWYLQTGEPHGKAGGYAIQGAGSLFVDQISGSLSNVIGLPLRETLEMFEKLNSQNH